MGVAVARYWLVGDAPPRDAEVPDAWLTPDDSGLPTPANRLLEITGWSASVFLSTLRPRVNLWSNPNRIWKADGQAHAAKIARASLADGSAGVIILGVLAARMFDLHAGEAMEWHGRFAFVPHPAGHSRDWTAENKRRAREFFAAALTEARASRTT